MNVETVEQAQVVSNDVQVGQVWKDLDRRANNRTITIQKLIEDGERAEATVTDGEGNTGKTIRVKTDRLNANGHWRLLKNGDGTLPESALEDAFEAVNEREGDRLNQLVMFGTPEFMVDSVGLSKHGVITVAGAEKARDVLLSIYGAVQLWLGDLENVVEATFGEEASQIIDAESYARHGISESSRKTYAWVAKRVPDENRRVAQSFGHMQAVAALRPDQQRKLLEESRAEDWSVSKLKVQVALKTEDGKTRLRFLLIVDAGTEAKQDKLAETLEAEGFQVTKKQAVNRKVKGPKKERKAKGDVTAKKRGKGKMSANRRRPG